MAFNERLADRIREALVAEPGVSERAMFGGLAFLVDGKMCVGVLGDELVVRSGANRYAEALRSKHARPMDFTGRVSTGMVYVSPAGVSRGPALRRWVDIGLTAAREAAPSRKRRPAAARQQKRRA